LRAVELGEVKLTDIVQIGPAAVRAGGALGKKVGDEAIEQNLLQLLSAMIVESDNTAADAVMARLGGPSVISRVMRSLGVPEVHVDRGERELHCDNAGVSEAECGKLSAAAVEARSEAMSVFAHRHAVEAYLSDPRDTATPRAMGKLLDDLHSGRVLSPSHTALLERMLAETVVGPARLRAGLPEGTVLMHRTGTGAVVGHLVSVVNDVGVIALPAHGAVVVSVYVSDGVGTMAEVEAVITEVAQAVWAHWAVPAPEERSLALTLDDGPSLEETPRLSPERRNTALLTALKAAHVQAALFVTLARGADRAAGLQLLRAWSAAGHRIGNHTVTHPLIDKVGLAAFEKEMLDCDRVIHGLPGFIPRFRFPFLKEGKTEDVRDGFRSFLAAHEYRGADVSIDASDWYYDQRLGALLRDDPTSEVEAYRRAYVAHMLDRAQYYDNLARRVLGRSPAHVVLAHDNLLNALFLSDVLAAFTAHGWHWISPDTAYADPMYAMRPTMLPAGESLVWSLARENGVSGLREPGEDGAYEASRADAAGL